MRNLINFIYRNHFFFVFLLLEVVCVFLILNNRSYQSTSILNSSNVVSANLYTAVANGKEYLLLKDENEKLARENAVLRNQLKSTYDILPQNVMVRNDTLYRKKYVYIMGKVINSTTNRRSNYLTLNIGSGQGVEKDFAIVNSEGIVGVVKDVSENFSTAISILHKDQKVICKIKKDGSYGPLAWDGTDYRYATLTDIPMHVKLVPGDTITTSALSDIFPEGIMVGIMESFERKQGDAFFTLKVRLNCDFKKLNHVYVIKNNYKAEQDTLENKIKPEKIK
jgi:rod shape-determining protein MreC